MAGLRMETDVPLTLPAPAARHVHVEVLEQLRHLRDEEVATPLLLHELEGAREPAVRPPGHRRHARGISRIGRRATRCAGGRRSRAAGGRTPTTGAAIWRWL